MVVCMCTAGDETQASNTLGKFWPLCRGSALLVCDVQDFVSSGSSQLEVVVHICNPNY